MLKTSAADWIELSCELSTSGGAGTVLLVSGVRVGAGTERVSKRPSVVVGTSVSEADRLVSDDDAEALSSSEDDETVADGTVAFCSGMCMSGSMTKLEAAEPDELCVTDAVEATGDSAPDPSVTTSSRTL